MRRQKSIWWQPEGWTSFGAVAVVILLVLYLVFMVVRYAAPRIRSIQRSYNVPGIEQGP